MDKAKTVSIKYTNWRGETSIRSIVPLKIWFGSTEWHKDNQWLLKAFDIDKDAERDFTLSDIQNWNVQSVEHSDQ
jgi:predicted DNA-binding transcriptional regulator YafY